MSDTAHTYLCACLRKNSSAQTTHTSCSHVWPCTVTSPNHKMHERCTSSSSRTVVPGSSITMHVQKPKMNIYIPVRTYECIVRWQKHKEQNTSFLQHQPFLQVRGCPPAATTTSFSFSSSVCIPRSSPAADVFSPLKKKRTFFSPRVFTFSHLVQDVRYTSSRNKRAKSLRHVRIVHASTRTRGRAAR